MIVKLPKYELYKALFTYKGIWLFLAFIILKTALLCALPEQKDARLNMTQAAYEEALYTDVRNLSVIPYGETTPEKERYIADTYAYFQQIKAENRQMSDMMTAGQITHDEYWAYYGEIEGIMSLINRYDTAFEMLNEKRIQFQARQRDGELPPPAYFYEYNWSSVLTYMGWFDPLMFVMLLVLAIQMICPEIASGAFRVNKAARYGHTALFFSKLIALAAMLSATAVVNLVLEISIFSARFDLSGGRWMLYSLSAYSDTLLPLTLSQAFWTLAVIRAAGFVAAGLLCWAISCLAGAAAQSAFCCVALIILPCMALPELTFMPGAWLMGKTVLLTQNRFVSALALFIIVSGALAIACRIRFGRAGNRL